MDWRNKYHIISKLLYESMKTQVKAENLKSKILKES